MKGVRASVKGTQRYMLDLHQVRTHWDVAIAQRVASSDTESAGILSLDLPNSRVVTDISHVSKLFNLKCFLTETQMD